MDRASPAQDLPLRYRTPDAWAAAALRDSLALLSDHAHLEKKAAANALELLNRWPERGHRFGAAAHEGDGHAPPADWVPAMTAIARDEVEHLAKVTRLLTRRGGAMTRQHRNAYANELRKLVRLGQGLDELLDRLLVSALIEARSCERFEILAQVCEDVELGRFYAGLCASERGHYRTFVDLAAHAASPEAVERRWSELLDAEAVIIAAQAPGPRMHSGA